MNSIATFLMGFDNRLVSYGSELGYKESINPCLQRLETILEWASGYILHFWSLSYSSVLSQFLVLRHL